MLNASIKAMSVGAALALAASGAFAQTTPSTSTQPPASVGVTPQDASQATQNAVPRSDTGTVVRTDQSAADRARDAANQVQNRTGTGTGTSTTNTTTGTTGNAGMSGSTSGSMGTGSSASNMDTNTNNTTGAMSSDMNSSGQRMGAYGTRRARADRN
ncbi:hypothetical protein [Acidovorax sp. SRB_24]|uniref:hypothetical protein n=1 Tax=Acidovorax sp. SRB_24 TaxID=1962700 RepID=UPI00145EE213|nr:hypothetical protein [Acidovorax sp. SRB_24]NMM78545.1 hypothetical protein [Acidovorax sp. SRB_24]NMM78736.1 hypothetical protein [Acidovorax sp. SRB_24]